MSSKNIFYYKRISIFKYFGFAILRKLPVDPALHGCQPDEQYVILKRLGAVAQLGERLNGIQEVVGSIPISSTIFFNGLRHPI